MARSNMTPVSVYLPNVTTNKVLEKAAELDNRTVSNFMVTAGLEKARQMGITKQFIASGED